jgi:hypothetical protein
VHPIIGLNDTEDSSNDKGSSSYQNLDKFEDAIIIIESKSYK